MGGAPPLAPGGRSWSDAMKQSLSLVLLLLSVALAGCTAPSVVMQDPKTQETLRCEATGFTAELAQLVIDECRKNYEKAGWVPVPS
jgi:hypothetical protein